MNINELQALLQSLNISVTAREICSIWGMNETTFSNKKKLGSAIKQKNIEQLERALNIKIEEKENPINKVLLMQLAEIAKTLGYSVEFKKIEK